MITNDLIARIRKLRRFTEVSSDRLEEVKPKGVFFLVEPEVIDTEVEHYLCTKIREEEIKFDYYVPKPLPEVTRLNLTPFTQLCIKQERYLYPDLNPEAFEKRQGTRTELKVDGDLAFEVQTASELDDVLFAIANIRETPWNSAGYSRLENRYALNRPETLANRDEKLSKRHEKLAQYGKQKCIEAYLGMAEAAALNGEESQTKTYLIIALKDATRAISTSPASTLVQLTSAINPYRKVVKIEGLLEKTLGRKPDLDYEPPKPKEASSEYTEYKPR